jgi:hypothetical protein
MTDRDRDRAEMRALCDLFRREMARQIEEPLFDQDARARIGHAIGSAVRQSGVGIRVFGAARLIAPGYSSCF